tara:strand:- start:114 stop:761 length:648 start_codon:yes stop_codon:yes gene_type:complete
MFEDKTLVKICGITSVEQALQIAKLGVDAIGVISVKESPRYVSLEKKKDIFRHLKKNFSHIKRVSVVKNIPLELICVNSFEFEDVIQLHGDENLSYCKKLRRKLPHIEIWKAFRIKDRKDIKEIENFSDFIDAVLLDSWNEKTYGGSGKRIKSKYLEELKFSKPWLLAGGISIDWLNQILIDIKPDGIDISSSIESSPGIKDLNKTKKLLNLIKR